MDPATTSAFEPAAEPPGGLIGEHNEKQVFSAINLVVVPLWAAMIVAPRSAITARLVGRADIVLGVLSAAYVAQLAASLAANPQKPDFGDIAKLRETLAEPGGFLVGWTHFLAFDLFVGRWIWQTALDEGRSARLATLLTFLLGPAGLGLFSLQRGFARSTGQV